MAVTSVKEHFKNRPGDIGDGIVRNYKRCFYVQTDSISDTAAVVMGAVGIPARFSSHPQDTGSIAVGIRADKYGEGGYAWEVTVDYSTEVSGKALKLMETAVPQGSQGQFVTAGYNDPLLRPPRISWSTVKYEEPVTVDIADGRLVENTAGLGFSPAPTRTVSGRVLRIVQNQVWFNARNYSTYEDTVNNATFWGYEAGLGKIESITGEYKNEEKKWFAEVTFEFHFRESITVTLRGGVVTTFFPWDLNPLNAGFVELIGTNSDGSNKYQQIIDGGGNPVSEPHPLAQDGKKLKPTATPYFRVFKIYRRTNFKDFGLPDPYP